MEEARVIVPRRQGHKEKPPESGASSFGGGVFFLQAGVTVP